MAAGGDGIILSLLSMPRMTVRAYLAVLPAVLRERAKKEAYRAYVTEALRIIGENTAKQVNGSYIKARYVDIISPKVEETRTSGQIVEQMKRKMKQISSA